MAGIIPDEGPAVVTIERAAEVLGIGRSTAYKMIREGSFPVRVITVGPKRRVVPLALLERFLLGDEQPTEITSALRGVA